jgi:uncharacterized protein YdeI (YjbR/CyaY-like superfamily)
MLQMFWYRIDMEPLFFTTADELREWFAQNHDRAQEVWIEFYKKESRKGGVTYPQAVDEALCFGWIDGIRKRVDDVSYMNRFTPRKKGSNWSGVNIKRVGELTELGRMQPPGLAAFNLRDEAKTQRYSYERSERRLPEEYEAQFQANAAAWAYWQQQPPSYRKAASWWVISAKQEATRLKRLAVLVDESTSGRRIPALRRNGE